MNKINYILFKISILFIIGGLSYILIEFLWRGYSHWSMFILGGLCFVLIGCLNNYLPWNMSIVKQMLCGSIVVTILEFITGCIVNLWFGWGVWDYSQLPFNILGQVCLTYMFLWFLLSGIVIVVDDFLRWKIFNEDFPHYYLFRKKG